MKIKFKISYDAGELASEMPKIIEKYMQRYARGAEKGSKEAIDKGLEPPLSEFTIEHRKNKGQGGSKPLFATGNLYRSIKGTSEGLEMLGYGLKHQRGYKNPIKNWARVPARPFIQTSRKEILTAFNKFKKDIRKAFKK